MAPLEEYRRKRRLARTPEPAGSPPREATPPTAPLRYVIQKHAARRLHYDVRLELDGVLKSWAVPKGPSLDPHERRLAVHVEDHPLEYGGFEGVIPAGEYGAGTVMVWDRGVWTPDEDPRPGYAEGRLKFEISGEKLRGRWTLVRMRGRPNETSDNWLLIKEADREARALADYDLLEAEPRSVATGRSMEEIADEGERAPGDVGDAALGQFADFEAVRGQSRLAGSARAPMPDRIGFQLATRTGSPPSGDEWLHEIKYDGYRAACLLSDGRARFHTRGGKDWTDRLAPLAAAAEGLPVRSAILDGEVVAFTVDGISSFSALQEALSAGEGTLTYVAFDVLYLDGADLRAAALSDRKALLAELLGRLPARSPLRYADHVRGKGEAFYREACSLALEGVISKRADRPHVPGRGRDWLKVRCLERQEFVIGGYTEPSGHRAAFGALLLGLHDPASGELRYAGRVGTGFSERDLCDLGRRLAALASDVPPFADPPAGARARGVHWVRPELVAEVTFLEWTRDGVLRQASFEGLREDKRASEAVLETPGSAGPGARPSAGGRGPSPSLPALTVAGVTLTNPDRVLYPGFGVTKAGLARYYEAIAEWMLPHVARRPLTLVRCPLGHDEECFYQKHADEGFPDAIRRLPVKTREGMKDFVYVEDVAGLVALVQLGTLELHTWGARTDTIERPDRIVFDLDPGPGLGWNDIVRGAGELRALLQSLGLVPFVKTSGGKGLHVVVPILRRDAWDDVRAFARAVAERLVEETPSRYTARMSRSERSGRLFVDYVRNARQATTVAPYSARARRGAPVSTPLSWKELARGAIPRDFDVHTVALRVRTLGSDPWAGMDGSARRLTRAMRSAVGLP